MLTTKHTAVIGSAALVLTGLLGGAAPAQAAPAPVAAGTAPSCIGRYVTGTPNGFDVSLSNNCGSTMRVKVIVNNGGDSPCYTMSNGSRRLFIYEGVFGTYDRTVTC